MNPDMTQFNIHGKLKSQFNHDLIQALLLQCMMGAVS